jgi:hypothetical protein
VIDLPAGRRCPPARWEAYLLIGVFPPGSAHAWTKAHVFIGRARPGRHCLSALEALDGPGEAVVLAADGSGVRRHAWSIDDASCDRAQGTWSVSAPHLEWEGFPASRLTVEQPDVEATATVAEGAWWARVPRLLSYFSAFGTLTWRDATGESRGLALLERAWGADAPLNVAALAPRRWQWDLLATGDGGVCAGLCAAGLGLRTMSRLAPREDVATGRRMRVHATRWRDEQGRRVPVRWEGTLGTRAGVLRYEARAATPVAPVVPGGGFVGTTWEGEWQGRLVSGTGFTEYRAASAT